MATRIVHTINGKKTSSRKFHDVCKSREKHHILIGDQLAGNHVFTDIERFNGFCSSHPELARSYLSFQARNKRAEQLRQQIGNRKSNAFEARKNQLLSQINDVVAKYLDAAEVEGMDDEIHLMQATVSPKLGSVAFYKNANYSYRFRIWEGYEHTTVCDLEQDANKLSSIWMWISSYTGIPARLTLYECAGLNEQDGATLSIISGATPGRYAWDYTTGSWRYHQHYYRIPDLAVYGFDNRTSSWAFWS